MSQSRNERDEEFFGLFQQTAECIYESAKAEGRLIECPENNDAKRLALDEQAVKKTKYGSIAVESEPTSRAAQFTKNNIDYEFGEEEFRLLNQARTILSREKLVSIDVLVGDGSEDITARLIVPKTDAHVAYGGRKLFMPSQPINNPFHQVIMFFDDAYEDNRLKNLPEKDITIRLAHSSEGRLVKIVRNSNYYGEWKKGVFAGEDYRTKQNGNGIFLHAGCRKDYLETARGGYHNQCSLFTALSANGKTSLTSKILARKDQGESWLVQDDGGILGWDGSFKGFEAGGIFVKTHGINPGDQIETFYGALKPETFLENVYVDENGNIDFFNVEKTSNGRAVIERRDFTHASSCINVEHIDNLFLITRGSTIPAISKLTHEQATALMVLGQSQQSSAGDPTQAGKIINEFFYDPFIAGDKTEHALLFYEILKHNSHMDCYLLNTGGIGEGDRYIDIDLQNSVFILDSLLRGGLEDWEIGGAGLFVPTSIRNVKNILLHPEKCYSRKEFEEKQSALDKRRTEILEQFPKLPKDITGSFKK